MGRNQRRGARGEALASHHLEAHGWTILDRNWRAGRAEVDLVARKGDVLAFVEVKARFQAGCGDPLEAITWKKRREVEGVARAWLAVRSEALRGSPQVRFDAISVVCESGRSPVLRHVPDAWRVGDL